MATRYMPNPEWMANEIKAVEIVSYPSVKESTQLADLINGLSAQLRIDIPESSSDAMLVYLTYDSFKKQEFSAYVSSLVRTVSPDLNVKAISFSKGSLFMTVVFGADGWIRSNVGANYDPLAPLDSYPKLMDALSQLNSDLMKAVEVIKDSFKDFFQSDVNP